MGIKETLAIMNAMEADGVIERYSIAGAVAAYNYVEAGVTEDLDVLVSFGPRSDEHMSGMMTLEPLFAYLKAKGYSGFRKEGLVVEGWPVQFLPVASDLDAEALERAVEISIDQASGSVVSRVLRPEHIVAIALRVARPKDLLRIAQFLEAKAVDPEALCGVLKRHGLLPSWRAFCSRTGISDPCKNNGETP
ncbi:MAG: hypothetical protein ACRED5_23115 [Propylenella sp.]